MLDRGASINQQQMAMCKCSDIPTVKYFVFCPYCPKNQPFLYIFKNIKKEREVPQVPIQKKPKGNKSIIFIFMKTDNLRIG
jgi:hypothetical protein